MTFAPYLPVDRYLALVNGTTLPYRTQGAALFADVSGFTPLTETLAKELGPRRGGEELTHHLNGVYEALITQIHNYHGSVIYFSGDAITCWFDGDPKEASQRSVTAAIAMQEAMSRIALVKTPAGKELPLALKVAVASGPVCRFVVGDPEVQFLDALAGSTLAKIAVAEHQANKGDIIISREVFELLQDCIEVSEWRTDNDSEESFGVVAGLKELSPIWSWSVIDEETVSRDLLRPWVVRPVYQRLEAGMSDFLTELRPAVALFIKFSGIDYDNDPEAGAKLDSYIRWLHSILKDYEGNLEDLTIGDKGSYLYVAFGAPLAHQNDAERAARTALTVISSPPPELNWLTDVQVGISRGTMRTGTVGSKARHIYGVLGDEVNLAARLMGAAKPGQILVSGKIRDATERLFEWESLQPINVKGKADPVRIYRLLDVKEQKSLLSHTQIHNTMPMVGRENDLVTIRQKIEQVLEGHGQILAITAEAGMGKSRMVAEIVRLVSEKNMDVFLGECQSYGTNNSYLPWQGILRNFFKVGLSENETLEEQIIALENYLGSINDSLVNRLPLLKAVLKLSIPENDLTQTLDAKLRKASLESLLVDCIRAQSLKKPLVLIIEDSHWLDPLSHDLLENIGRAINHRPILIVLAYRPPEIEYLQAPRITQLPICSVISLNELNPEEGKRFITMKIAQIGLADEFIPETVIESIFNRAQGNPFFIQEILNYMSDLKIDPNDPKSLEQLELPNSLHSLILSRLDRLSETQKIILKVSSVIGRVFKLEWLRKLLPNNESIENLKHELEELRSLDLTPLEQPEPDLAYTFNHIVTREVAYESMPFSTRELLHGRLGDYVEQQYQDNIDQYVDLLAYHYYLSPQKDKKRLYLRRAGETAQSTYANSAAIEYYRRLLPLLPEPEQVWVKLKLGEVLELVSQWSEAEELFRQGLQMAEQNSDLKTKAFALSVMGSYLIKQKRYTEAQPWLTQALAAFTELKDAAGVSKSLTEIGDGYRLQGEFKQARDYYDESLKVANTVSDYRQRLAVRALAMRGAGTASLWQGDYATAGQLFLESQSIMAELGDKPNLSKLLTNMGVVARAQGDIAASISLTEQSLAQFRELGDRWAVSVLLNNLGILSKDRGDFVAARRYMAEGLSVQQRLGDKSGSAVTLSSLGDLLIDQGDYTQAYNYLMQSLALNQELGNPLGTAYALEYLAGIAAAEKLPERTAILAASAKAIRDKIEVPLSEGEQESLNKRLEPACLAYGEEEWAVAWEKGKALSQEAAVAFAADWKK